MIAKIRCPLVILLFIYFTNSASLFSQSVQYIDGKVINTSNSKPVPFATIKLQNNQLGVYANADGDFKLIRSSDFQTDSLIITCIGYRRNSIAFKDLRDSSVNKIYLAPSIYGLAEVKITAKRGKLNSITIIDKAIRSIEKNYPDTPFSFISYYRDYQKRAGNYINLNEAIIQTLDSGFTTKSILNKYRLLDFKKNMDFPKMSVSQYYDDPVSVAGENPNKIIPNAKLGDQYGNELFVLMVHDAIRNFKVRSFSYIDILSSDFLRNHNFSEPKPIYNNNLLLYKIDFTGKSHVTGDSLLFSGAIYIQPRDYSIHKLEYNCFYLNKVNGLKEMFNIDTEYGYENSVNSLMCLKYISFNNIFNVLDPSDSTYFRILNSYWDNFHSLKPSLIIDFNNKLDPKSATRKANYDIKIGKKSAKIQSVVVGDKKIFIRLEDDNAKGRETKGLKDSTYVSVKNIKDIDGNILNRHKYIELYQYRELFVQEYNRTLPFNNSCYIRYSPLEQNCISKYSGVNAYWMNTPENIKPDK